MFHLFTKEKLKFMWRKGKKLHIRNKICNRFSCNLPRKLHSIENSPFEHISSKNITKIWLYGDVKSKESLHFPYTCCAACKVSSILLTFNSLHLFKFFTSLLIRKRNRDLTGKIKKDYFIINFIINFTLKIII